MTSAAGIIDVSTLATLGLLPSHRRCLFRVTSPCPPWVGLVGAQLCLQLWVLWISAADPCWYPHRWNEDKKTKRDEKYTKTSRFSYSNVCASVPTGPLPRPGPPSWRSFRSRWRKKTSVLSNWSTLLTGICHWLAWMSRSLDRSSSQTQMRRTTERGMSHPNTTIYTINIIYFSCLRQFPWKENVWETVSACCTKC